MTTSVDEQIVADIASFYADPLSFVMYAFPWSEPGSQLEQYDGPAPWQKRQLALIGMEVKRRGFDGKHSVQPVQFATTSGHGVGKSAMVSWLVLWIMSTRPGCKGTITANTLTQLQTKTFSELSKWHQLSINKDWFEMSVGGLKIWQVDDKAGWFAAGQSCKDENSESFAGQHNASSTSFYIFDEASAIPDKIWSVAEGGLTDGEPMIYVFGNPTRNSGAFRDCFGSQKHRWITDKVDSREVAITNKAKINEWIEDWGEDSDFVRVRVRGEFPRQGSKQFIDSERVFNARKRAVAEESQKGLPKTLAIDVARFGDDQTVFTERYGAKVKILGKFRGIDTMQTAAHAVDIMSKGAYDACFVDDTGVGGGVTDRIKQLGYSVVPVNAGCKATNSEMYANLRAEMYGNMRDWLLNADIPEDQELIDELQSIEYGFTAKQQIQLEPKAAMKSRLGSPDCADSLALHFAYPVGQSKKVQEINFLSEW